MSGNEEPDDREAKRRKSLDAQEGKQQEKVEQKSKEVSEEGNPMDSTLPAVEEENPESKHQETESEVVANSKIGEERTEAESEIEKQKAEVAAIADAKGSHEATRKAKRVPLILPFKRRPDGGWYIGPGVKETNSAVEFTQEVTSAEKTVSDLEQVDLERAIQLSKESYLMSSMGINPNAPGETSSAPAPPGDTVRPESGDFAAEVKELNTINPSPVQPEGILLFEMQVPYSNWLVIQEDAAAAFFPTIPAYCESNIEEELQITDCNSRGWIMTLVNYTEENVYLISKGWSNFADWHNLEPTDVIAFYMPVDILADKHYAINFVELGENTVRIPGFARGDFLFDLELQLADIEDGRLFLPTGEVETHFPAVKMEPGTIRTREIVRFTDVHGKHWYMEITFHDGVAYMITEGWHNFVEQHELNAMNRILFYMPAQPLHAKHFLIEWSDPSPKPPGDEIIIIKGSDPGPQPPGGEISDQEIPSRLSRQVKGKEKVFDF